MFSSDEALLLIERVRKNTLSGDFSMKFGMPDRIRTYDLQLRKLTLYPAELRARNSFNYWYHIQPLGFSAANVDILKEQKAPYSTST